MPLKHVLDDVLRGQADGHAGHAGRGQQRRQIDAHGGQNLHADDGADDGQAGGANDAGQGFHLGNAAGAGGVLLGDADHAAR